MEWWRVKAADDRGRAVRLHAAVTRIVWPFVGAPGDPVREVARIAQRRARGGMHAVMHAAILLFAMVLIMSGRGNVADGVRWAGFFALMSFDAFVLAPVAWCDGMRKFKDDIVSMFLSRGACACCGHSLANLPAAEDGCVVCPECGAAWKRERIGGVRGV